MVAARWRMRSSIAGGELCTDRRTLRPRWRTPVSRSTDDVGHGRSVARPYCCPYPRDGDPHQIFLSSATERQRNGRGSQQGLDDGRIVVIAPVRLSRGQTIVQRFFRCRLKSSRPSVLLSQASNGRRNRMYSSTIRINGSTSRGRMGAVLVASSPSAPASLLDGCKPSAMSAFDLPTAANFVLLVASPEKTRVSNPEMYNQIGG